MILLKLYKKIKLIIVNINICFDFFNIQIQIKLLSIIIHNYIEKQ